MEKFKKFIIVFTMTFLLGCLLGYAIELVWYLVKHGILMGKPGLLYGPLKPIYGLGFSAMAGLYYLLKDVKSILLFVIGFIFGGVFEYLMAVIEEKLLNAYSWTYASFNMNIGGKVYIPYCFVWGLLFILFIKLLYPKIEKIILKTPFVLALIINILLLIDGVLTSIAIIQYSNRVHKIPTTNSVLKIIDEKYDNDYMKKKFPNLRIIKEKKEVKKNG